MGSTDIHLKYFYNISKSFQKCIVHSHFKFLVCLEIALAETFYRICITYMFGLQNDLTSETDCNVG